MLRLAALADASGHSAEFGYFDTFAVAWSLADLAGRTQLGVEEVKTAMGFGQTGADR